MPRALVIYPAPRLNGTVWRAVEVLPPSERDFRSYTALGRDLPSVDYLRLASVSMYLSREGLETARERYGLPPQSVELDLRTNKRIQYAVTNERTGHIEVWAPPDVLLACVVSPT